MFKLIAALCVLATLNVNAAQRCISKLTDNYAVDSRSFKVDMDNVDLNSDENDYIAQSIELIRAVLNFHGCDGDRDINFGHGPNGRTKHSCQNLVSYRPVSQACYIETSIGFFFLTRDLQTTAYITFNRWD